MSNDKCLFCGYEKFDLVAENEHTYAIRDKYPDTELHTLIITKKHYDEAFDLPSAEIVSIFELAKKCHDDILKQDKTVRGFNFKTNAGREAGQKICHVHFHLIPRREGNDL